MASFRTLAIVTAVTTVALIMSGCVPTADEVDVEIGSVELDGADVPEDTGSIRTGMAEILGDLAVLEPAVAAAIPDMVESERLLGQELRAGEPATVPDLEGGGTSRGAGTKDFDTFGASMVLVGGLAVVGLSSTMASDYTRDMTVAGSETVTGTGTKASSVSEGGRTVERTGANEVSLGIEQTSQSTVDGVSVSSTNSVTIEGKVCPEDDGQFDFTITVFSDAAGGPGESKAAAMQTMIVRVTGALDDNGNPGEMTIEGHQATRHTRADGSAVYVETTSTAQGNLITTAAAVQASKPRLVKKSDNATDADVKQLAQLGSERMSYLALGVLAGVQTTMWTNGCVRIDAPSPGTVQAHSTTEIPVTTMARLSQEEFPSRVGISLSGPEKVDKTSIRTAEAFSYVAGAANTKATITLDARSRRGTATMTLAVSTGSGAYHAIGGGGAFHGEGTICDLTKPFTISGSGVEVRFTPADATGGSYTYQGNMSGVVVYGGESYEVQYNGEVATGIRGWGMGTIEAEGQSASGYGEENYALTPLSPTPDSCTG